MTTNKKQTAFTPVILVFALFIGVSFACNNSASTEEKKADSTATMDSSVKMSTDTAMKSMADTTKSDTSKRETKAPPPPKQ